MQSALRPDLPIPGSPSETPSLRDRLRARLAGGGAPHLIRAGGDWAGTSRWEGSRWWARQLRESGLGPGDRVVCALPAGASFVELLVACLCEGLTLALAAPHTAGDDLLELLDARLLVADDALSAHRPAQRPRAARQPATPDVALLLRTSGSSGAPRWVALSEANLLAVLDSHAPHLALGGARVMSVLPWHHACGLVLGLLAGLLHADTIVRDPLGGRDVAARRLRPDRSLARHRARRAGRVVGALARSRDRLRGPHRRRRRPRLPWR